MAYTKEEYERMKLEEICEQFTLDNQQLIKVKNAILTEIRKGLKSNTNAESDIKCLPTFVQDLPSGCEHGMYVVITLRTTNFHLLFVHLRGQHKCRTQDQVWGIPEIIQIGDELFNFIVEKLVSFLKSLNLEREPLSLTFVVPFPLIHSSIKMGKLVAFTRGSRLKGVEKRNMGVLLEDAIERNKTKIRVNLVALINDVTGVLAACAFHHKACKISVIIDMGCNIAYLEKVKNIETLQTPFDKPNMIVNTELGGFGSHQQLDFIYTSFDEDINSKSTTAGSYIFEKMISGLYIVELIRKVMLACIDADILFDGNSSATLRHIGSIRLQHVKDVISEGKGPYDQTQLILDRLGISNPPQSECAKVYYIMYTLIRRSAHLLAAAIAAIIEKLNQPSVCIGIDGVLYCDIPFYHQEICEKLTEILPPRRKFELVYANDVYGKGGAIIAALTTQRDFLYTTPNEVQN